MTMKTKALQYYMDSTTQANKATEIHGIGSDCGHSWRGGVEFRHYKANFCLSCPWIDSMLFKNKKTHSKKKHNQP